MFSIIFGNVIDALGGSPTIAQLVHEVNKVTHALQLPQAAALPSCGDENFSSVSAGVLVLCVSGNCSLCRVLCRDWTLDVDRSFSMPVQP